MQAMSISEQPCCINYCQLMNNLRRYYLLATDVNDNANDGKQMLNSCMSKRIMLIRTNRLHGNDRHMINLKYIKIYYNEKEY